MGKVVNGLKRDKWGNCLSKAEKDRLNCFEWGENSFLDLHGMGVHWYSPEYMPTIMKPEVYAALSHRGLTAPISLPLYFPRGGVHERIDDWLEFNYFRLSRGGVHYLGNECNLQSADAWDSAECRVCFCRLSPYAVVDGSFGQHLVGNFITDFTDNVFIDYAYLPDSLDIPLLYGQGFPLMFGNATKRPLSDFDIVFFAQSYPQERVNAPVMWVKSGLPLYRWERFSSDLPYGDLPLVVGAGLGASFIENLTGDNPVHGLGGNSLFDHVLIGEGELAALKYIQEWIRVVKRGGGTKLDFMGCITNTVHEGLYDPSCVLYEYADKVHILRDRAGNELGREVFEQAGSIRRISLIDEATKTKHILVGEGSEEFADMLPIQKAYLKQLGDGFDGVREMYQRGVI